MKKYLTCLAALSIPLLSSSWVQAAINPAIVSSDARWVVYADLNALRTNAIGKEFIAMAEKAQLDTGNGKVGIDWQKLISLVSTATAYGSEIGHTPKDVDGTLVVQGNPDLRKIAEGLLLQANLANPAAVVELTDLPFPAYAIHNTKAQNPEEMALVIAFPQEPIIIISKSKPQILKAREVFNGTAPSLAKNADSPLKKYIASASDAYLFTASVIPAEKFFPEDGPQGRVLKMANSGSIAIGERGANTYAHSELVASSDQMADKLLKILQGMTAMMSLVETSDKELADFLNSASVNRNGDTVTFDMAYSTAQLAKKVSLLKDLHNAKPHQPVFSPMINGKAVVEWQAEPGAAVAEGSPAPIATRSSPSVALKNGTLITLAQQKNGGKNVRFDRVEISPAEGAGAPLVFLTNYMRTGGPRGNWLQFQFPGADGNYTIKVSYVNDTDGKAKYAVSVKDPQPQTADPEKKM